MTWVKIDDQFRRHPKVRRLSSFAIDLYVTGLCYCSSGLTDGAIDQQGLEIILAETRLARKRRSVIQELLDAELWLPVHGGFLVKDFLDYNPPAEKVREERAKARVRMQRLRSGERSGEQTTNVRRSFGDPVPSRKDQKPLGDAFTLALVQARSAQERALTGERSA